MGEKRKRRKEWNELAMIWEERQERMEKNKRKRTEEEIEKANKRVKKIPLRHKLRDRFIERLQNTNIERTDTENIAGLPKLLYKEKEKNDIEEIISERKGTKRFRCENCDEIINGKALLTRHTKNKKEWKKNKRKRTEEEIEK